MRRRSIPIVLIVTFVAIAVTVVSQYYDEITKAPRVRVGPMVRVEPERNSLRFFALGDTGTGGEDQLKVAKAMEQRCRDTRSVDGILLLGDNSYQAGFTSVDDPDWQLKIETPYGSPCISKVPIYPVLGNHDYKGNPAAQIEYSLVNPRWRMPNRFYAVTFGRLAKIIAFDSQTSEFCGIPAFCSLDFLWFQTSAENLNHNFPSTSPPNLDPSKDDSMPLTSYPTTWNIIMGHHPIVSSSEKGYDHAGGVKGKILKYLFCQRADLWLAGHAHHLEYRKPEGCRLDLVVSGGGGAPLYGIKQVLDSEVMFAKSAHGFVEIEINPSQLQTRFFDDEGQLIYENIKSVSK